MSEVKTFRVTCKQCNRDLVIVERIRDPEIKTLVDHLRACCPDPLAQAPALGEIMARVRVTSATT